ncbi:FR47-like protein [Musa troglodytarum]|uniref:FR47-like protein n=1 Tax=Musa troglodytarum TaxID=320322 RepID=A0A9E7HN87_9LILI|nr:FR47-like protein [Musa troglodytarum]
MTTMAVGPLALRPRSPTVPGTSFFRSIPHFLLFLARPCNLGIARRAEKEVRSARWRSHALSRPTTPEYGVGLIRNGLPVLHLPEHELQEAAEDEDDDDGLLEVILLYLEAVDDNEVPTVKDGSRKKVVMIDGSSSIALWIERIWRMVGDVRAMLRRMGDGEISISAYDTAWVALVKNTDGSGGPRFPSSLQWIVDNQLPDGSWGDAVTFSAHDRMINTLACVIALKSWTIYPDSCSRGLAFIRENMWRLREEEAELMPIGFEVAFPSLLDIAKALELEIPYGDPSLQEIDAKRNLKLKRIPRDVMHEVPTTLLHSLEGMPGLEWDRLLRLQCSDGSFLFSPSSTAFAAMQTGDDNCLNYLQRVIHRFGGGVPNVYPVDLFEHLWVVDRLERLGISRYFEPEIKDCLDYVYRFWTEDGICWAKNTRVHEVDDTSMGFRLLRLHGYDVSAGVFRHFEKDGEFFCFAGQSTQAVTGMYNLNRASQVAFPGEEILDRARSFSYLFLREKQAADQVVDKWIITKDLPGEVAYALDFPWYASLPRVETRLYLEQYGGSGDVWIGKTLYRMPLVNNDVYLELAKSDYNRCQCLHQLEWFDLEKWYEEAGLRWHRVNRRSLLRDYFLAAACVFEPDRAVERLGWARTAAMATAVSSYFSSATCTDEMRRSFIRDFLDDRSDGQDISRMGGKKAGEVLVGLLRQLIERLAADTRPAFQQQLVRHHLQQAWKEWLMEWHSDGSDRFGREETGLLLVRTMESCAGRFCSTELMATGPSYGRLGHLLSSLCHNLRRRQMLAAKSITEECAITSSCKDKAVEAEMRELARCVLQTSDDVNHHTKQTFLLVAKSFYYAAHCSPSALHTHISKVLFEPVA